MTDNTTLNPGFGGDVITTDDIGTSKVQIVKAGFGADGALTTVQNAQGSGLPVQPQVGTLVTGTVTNVNDDVIIPCLGATAILVQMGAQNLVGATLVAQGAVDGVLFTGLTMQVGSSGSVGTNLPVSAALVTIPCLGMQTVRIRLTAVSSGSAVINARAVYGASSLVSMFAGTIGLIGGPITPGTGATNLGKAEDAVHTSGDTGVAAWGVRFDSGSSAFSSAAGDYSPIGVDAFGSVLTTYIPSGSSTRLYLSTHTVVSAATTNATVVQAAQGVIHNLIASNTTAAWKYLKLFNKASAPTVGTDTPTSQIPIPPNQTIVVTTGQLPIRHGVGIAYAITGAAALLDATAVAVGDVVATIWYV